jgi:hypothetical protein
MILNNRFMFPPDRSDAMAEMLLMSFPGFLCYTHATYT